MALIDFPNQPNDGDVFEAPNGVKYVWNASKMRWECVTDDTPVSCVTNIYVGSDPPPMGQTCQGSLWFDCDNGSLYIYYQESSVGSSAQWVSVVSCLGGSSSLVLEDLLDVTFGTPPVNGEVLAYSGGVWANTSAAAAFNVAFADLTDTNFTVNPLTEGDFVRYDSLNGWWENTQNLTLGNNTFFMGEDTSNNPQELIGLANNDVIGVGYDTGELNFKGTVVAFTTYKNDVSISGLYSDNTTLRSHVVMTTDDKTAIGDSNAHQTVILAETPVYYPAVREGSGGSVADYPIIHKNNVDTVNIGELGNVDTTTTPPVTGDYLIFDGTDWVPTTNPVLALFEANNDGDAATGGVGVGELYRVVGGTSFADIRTRLV